MQKKIFLQKNTRSNGKGDRQSSAKLLLLAALALLVLVVVTPLIMSQKGSRDTTRRSLPEKGLMLKEIPRAPEPKEPQAGGTDSPVPGDLASKAPGASAPQSAPDAGTPADKPIEAQPKDPHMTQVWVDVPQQREAIPKPAADPTAEPAKAENTAPTPKPLDTPQPAEGSVPSKEKQAVASTEKGSPQPKPGEPAATKPDMKPKTPPAVVAKKSKPAGPPEALSNLTQSGASPTAAQPPKPATPGGRHLYSVQVGSFKDRQNAEEMRQNLQKRGYETVLKPTVHPKLGQLYVVQLKAVEDAGRANTLLEQIKNEERVRPMIIKVPQE